MNAMDMLTIAPFLNDCPQCGYGKVGTNEKTNEFHGALKVGDNLYTRKCRCGFEVTIDTNDDVTKETIQKKIDEALEAFKSAQQKKWVLTVEDLKTIDELSEMGIVHYIPKFVEKFKFVFVETTMTQQELLNIPGVMDCREERVGTFFL